MSETTKQRLRVSAGQLETWIRGQAKMPDRKLLVLADVLDSWARCRKPAAG